MTNAQLKAFHAVARFGSFTAASHHLALSQPAISDHVRKLEDAYGTQMFVRNAKGASLTPLGKKLYAIVERLVETESEASALLSQAKSLEQGELKIGADAAVHILQHMRTFNQKFPSITLKLSSGNSSELIAMLTDFSLDFAVVATKPADTAIASLRLRLDPFVALVPKHEIWKHKTSTSLAELAKHTFIIREDGSATKSSVQNCFLKAGVRMGSCIEIEGREATQEAVALGLGVTIISKGELTPGENFMALQISDCKERMEEWLIWLKSRSNLRVVESFLQLFRNISTTL